MQGELKNPARVCRSVLKTGQSHQVPGKGLVAGQHRFAQPRLCLGDDWQRAKAGAGDEDTVTIVAGPDIRGGLQNTL